MKKSYKSSVHKILIEKMKKSNKSLFLLLYETRMLLKGKFFLILLAICLIYVLINISKNKLFNKILQKQLSMKNYAKKFLHTYSFVCVCMVWWVDVVMSSVGCYCCFFIYSLIKLCRRNWFLWFCCCSFRLLRR